MKKFALLLSLVACSQAPVEVVPQPAVESEPIVIVVPEPTPIVINDVVLPAKFAVGDKIKVEGIDAVGAIMEVGPVVEWTNNTTGDKVMSRAYLFEFKADDGETYQFYVPELVITKV